MEPPDGAAPARLGGQSTPNNMATQSADPIGMNLNYASKVVSSSSPTSSTCQGRESVIATHTIHNGMPAVLFKAIDYYGVMAEECKLTIVGRFLKPRPQIDKIRVIEIEGQQMWLQKWSPDFKPEEDLPIAPVWVLLPGLPFHKHTWNYVKQVVSTIGTPLEMDLATKGRTRPSMAKVRVEIDLLKEQPTSVYVGQIYDNAPQKGFVQKIEFEGVPKYCKFCRKLGHNLVNCRSLERKKAAENRELEAKKNAKNQNEDNRLLGDQNMESGNKLGTVTNRENTGLVDQSSEIAATVSAESVEAGTDANAGQSKHRINQKQKNENLKTGTAVNRESVRLGDQNKESKAAEYAEFAGPAEHTDQNKKYISAESETANKAGHQEHSFSQKKKSEKQNPGTAVYSENVRLVDQNKEFEVNESAEIDGTGTATNTEQTINRISRMQNNESKSDKHLQQLPSNIRERSRKKTKKSKNRKLPQKRAKVLFKPMYNLSDDSSWRKKHNKEISLALQNMNQNSADNNVCEQGGQANVCELGDQPKAVNEQTKAVNDQAEAVNDQLPSRSKLDKQEQKVYTNDIGTRENMQESIRENENLSERDDYENNQIQERALNLSDYVNESTSVPSEIRNHPGIEMVVDLNMESNLKQDRYVTSQQIEIWIMWSSNNMTTILSNHDQQLTIKLHYGAANSDLYITAVYAKCTLEERRELWNSLELTNLHVNGPWCIGGDFNVILDPDEKKVADLTE
ncbi:hypothetical protein A4A49_00345 [Nicotiana attenuata]|uniref:Uncharacterized protein n=1 Tax=Nicotiana attenuata TaxID=49451 RepID=A0A314LB07_NICAT|nr:hypothetical protein A4A49_00345 [Nicotiana attenuata]